MWASSDDSTVLMVDPLPLRSLGLVGIVNRLFQGIKSRAVFVMPDDLDEWIQANHQCSVIIYNVGEASVADHGHLKRIRTLRKRMTDVPLVIFSYNNSRKEVLSAMKAGARGFVYAGTEIDLARQALSLVSEGGSNFSVATQKRRSISASCSTIMDDNHGNGVESRTTAIGVENLPIAQSAKDDLTQRQKAVLEGLSCGESNKAIARRLGIREGTIKVHVRRIMRKLGVANRTQVAIACAGSSGAGPAVSQCLAPSNSGSEGSNDQSSESAIARVHHPTGRVSDSRRA
jgi:DNA-binding NarL/FixJ family response regulator